jgi:hypothetical protein
MADVPDHLVPEDGLTDSFIRFDALHILHGQQAVEVTFGIYDEDQHLLGNFEIVVANEGGGTNALIAAAHRQMTDVLRQWLYTTDTMRKTYENQ